MSSCADRTDNRRISRERPRDSLSRPTNSPDGTVLDDGRRVRIRTYTCIAIRCTARGEGIAVATIVSRDLPHCCSYTSPESRIRRMVHISFGAASPLRFLRTRRHCRAIVSTPDTCHNNEKLLKTISHPGCLVLGTGAGVQPPRYYDLLVQELMMWRATVPRVQRAILDRPATLAQQT